ncbi:Unknown protein sequence [Pseudomonas syringae pv. maculicola]|nr:Unknown protein sequence [Pseudomonas syringae pv. maculicola]
MNDGDINLSDSKTDRRILTRFSVKIWTCVWMGACRRSRCADAWR